MQIDYMVQDTGTGNNEHGMEYDYALITAEWHTAVVKDAGVKLIVENWFDEIDMPLVIRSNAHPQVTALIVEDLASRAQANGSGYDALEGQLFTIQAVED